MTAFNVESTFLDLKKKYQHFEYANLIGEGTVDGGQSSDQQESFEGMTQNTYLFVQEKTTLIKDTQNLSVYFMHKHCQANPRVNQVAFDKFPFEKVKERVCFIFQRYQEQPTLLDGLLQHLVQPIMNATKIYLAILMKKREKEQRANDELHALLQIISQLTKVRGDKYIIQHFPHQVKDLYPALGFLAREKGDVANWQSRFIILLWLGVIALVPFDLNIIDSGVIVIESEEGGKATQIVDVMLQIGKFYLKSLTKMRQASALFISKLFTRPDIQKRGVLPKYIHYVLDKLKVINNNPLQNFFVCGLYQSLCSIFKRVQRSELLPLIPPVLELLNIERQTKANSAKKQLMMRLLTRIGLTYLKPRVAVWAFRKKTKSLLGNLSGVKKTTLMTNTHLAVESKLRSQQHQNMDGSQDDTQYYSDVDKVNLQDIIDMLIEGLSQKETTVREEASKGLGVIAGRLSQDMVLDVLDYILNLTPSPQTQHAVCLTIAELIRRNLLSPEKVKELYPMMDESLLYEKEQGGYSVGQAVRDSACYMTWSVARGYEQGGFELGISLIIAACFDREVGCRRAASAAYQELVGRVGDVPHGIQILTEADYFTLGPQKNAYLNVAIFIASYQQYFRPLVQHLCYQKLRHWDLQIKRIAACSLSLMVPLNPAFFGLQILQSLLNYLKSDIINVKLGTIIGIGEILLGLKGLSHNHQLQNEMKDSVFLKSLTQNEKKLLKAGEYMQKFKDIYEKNRLVDNFELADKDTLKAIVASIIAFIKEGKLYKGKAGQNFRVYTCRLLECFALCAIPLEKTEIAVFKDFIEENIKNPQEIILFSAVKCLKPFLRVYHALDDAKFIHSILSQAKVAQGYSRCYTLALSKLNKATFLHHFTDVVAVIEQNCKITKQNNDPQKRKYAIQCIQALIDQVGFDSDQLNSTIISKLFDILARTIEDYTMDKRGDIGSIVREQSMTTMLNIIKSYSRFKKPRWEIQNKIVARMIGLFLQQLNEKIDRIRLLAGSLLQNFFDNYVALFNIPQAQALLAVFGQENIRKLIKQAESKIDSNLQTKVIKMEMKMQQTMFNEESDRSLVYLWNLPHNVYPITVPLLALKDYSLYVLKGLSTSTGGISESIIKFSLQELGNYLGHISSEGRDDLMSNLLQEVIQLMKLHYKEERVIVPLYKTVDFLLEREQLRKWKGIYRYDTQIYYLIEKELNKTKSILKVSAASGLFVSLLSLNNEETKAGIVSSIINILCSDLPKARKILSDQFLLLLMSQEEFVIFSQEQTEMLILLLSDNDFLEQKLDVERIKAEIKSILST